MYFLESTDSLPPLLLYALPVDDYEALAIEYQVVRSDDNGAQDVWFIHERLDLEGGSIRLVPAADAGDALVVYYAFEYSDGTSNYFIQPYPHREE